MSIIKNFLSHNVINLVNILIPLVTYPYIISALGLSSYGIAVFVINLFSIGMIFCEFAFSLTGSKKIVRCRNKKEESLVFSQIILSKLLLFLIVTPVLIVFSSLKSDATGVMILAGVFITLSEVFNLTWYFIAKGKTHYAAVCVVAMRLISIPLIFVFIKNEQDIISYLVIFSSTTMIISILQMIIAISMFKIKLRLMPFKHLTNVLKQGKAVFFGRITSSLKDRYLGVWLGFFSSHEVLAVYDILFKVTNLVMGPVYSVSVILFPRLSDRYKKQNFNLNKFIIYGVVTVVIMSGSLGLLSEYILLFFEKNGSLIKYSLEMQLMLISMPFLFVSSMLGSCYLVVRGRIKTYNLSILASLLVMAGASFILLQLNAVSVMSISLLFVITAFSECTIRLVSYYNNERK
ncbi:hypothetical protein CAY59_16025 [Vibrio campbellii]|uniref:oligosaccharide flippase family protein n=1 Tax=Vibrio campbellii TaxID=680 RepID=UPI000A2F9E36|nr:oligosaccharide flippase family protein [Vibrio campbellii]ARR45728.1 hypothetical protein CAY59_16025 [Vibrio campbellii]